MPTQESWIEIDGHNVRYLRAGGGPPLVLVHGLAGGSFCWRFNIPALAEHYTIYAVDLPGNGLSDAPANTDCGMQPQAERLNEFLEKLRLEEVNVAGSSFGGGIAMFLAARHKSRLRSLVLAAPVNPWSALGRRRIALLNTALGGYLLRLAMPLSRPVHRIAINRLYGDPRRIRAGTVESYGRLLQMPGRVANVLSMLKNWQRDMQELEAIIPQIELPTLLVWGTRDGAVDLRSATILKQHLSKAELITLPEIGHIPPEEVPEEFNHMVMEFVSHPERHDLLSGTDRTQQRL
ncbi:MAG: hypothetical protein DMG65_07875 [Candidatus Angelobacter sp. Gp1-AA117]|nr:MAG: hypothetical protein DMG65_07875 [Candidatus Angelobacter sp. Gp1-AA117]